MITRPSFKYPVQPLTFGHQVSELILGLNYFTALRYTDKLKVIDLLYPLSLAFFKTKNIAANFLNAFVLREELLLFVSQNLIVYSNYAAAPDTRSQTGKKIDNTVRDVRIVLSQYLRFRDDKINPRQSSTKSSTSREERLILGMPESVAPIAISLFALMLFYLAWIYIIKEKK